MAKYLPYDYSQNTMLAVNFEDQIQPGSFEHALHYLIEHKLDLSIFHPEYHNEASSMSDLFPNWPLFPVFLAASFVLAVTPGPGVVYIVTRSVVHGRHQGLLSVIGVALGNFGNACFASLGLATLFAVSAAAFMIVKYVGALYLVCLGIQMLRQSARADAISVSRISSRGRVFLDGLIVALFNPKTTLFYAAFLPQFLDPSVSPVLHSTLLGAVFVVIAAMTDCAYALAASSIAPLLRTEFLQSTGKRIGGSMFIGLGIFTALLGQRSGR